MSTIIIIGGDPQRAQRTMKQEQDALEQVLKDAEALREAGYEVQIYQPAK